MTTSSPTQDRIKSIDDRLARLRAARSALAARASVAERKRDTRRKILIGAAVLAALDHGEVPTITSSADLTRWLDSRLTRPHDRAVFDLPCPEPAPDQSKGPQATQDEQTPDVSDKRAVEGALSGGV